MWDIRHRPLTFADVLGQEGTVLLLKARLSKGTALDTSYVFSGGFGNGKCVRGDTLVPTSRGLVPISSLMGPHQIDPLTVEVAQEDGSSVSAYSYRGGLQGTVQIRTYLGFELEGTPNHRIRVLSSDGNLSWKCLGEIHTGDYACIVRRGVFGCSPDISGFLYTKSTQDRASIEFHPPTNLDVDWCRLMGYMVGDGYCKDSHSVVIACAESDVKTDILYLLRRFGGTATDTPDKRRPGLSSLRCYRVQLRAFLAYLGVAYVGAEEKTIPWSVLASSEPLVRAFLQAYFESDGSASGHTIEAVTKSKPLAAQLQVLLAALGIVTRKYPKNHPKYGVFWRIRVLGTSFRTFYEKVGFVSARKTRALHELVEQAHARGTRHLTNIHDVVPNQTGHVASFYTAIPKSRRHGLNKVFQCRHGRIACTATQVARIATDFPDVPGAQHFVKLHAANYVYDPVVSVTQGVCEVFDLNVPQGECFSANGFMNHNTTIARILARAMLCLDLPKDDPEPCNRCENCLDILAETSTAFVEQDAASRGTIEHIRAIVDNLPFAVFNAPKRVHLLDEAHRMSRDAQDVLLKPLEDKKMVGIFCTTEPEKIRGPIRSRCEEYALRRITREDIFLRMKKILSKEGVSWEDDALLTIIDYSGGHVRDVINRTEMIAQAGGITVDTVREYLHLNVVSTYYQILLALGDSKLAIELVERATAQVTPEEVAAGLAEAAMNSFRLAHGMTADFVYVDRLLAKQLWEKFGPACMKLAEYFLRARYVSQVSLVCDVLNLVSGIPQSASTSCIIQIASPLGASVSASVSTSAPAPTPIRPHSPSTPLVVAPSPAPVEKPLVSDLRPDGVGNMGSSDIQATTVLDKQGVPTRPPRMAQDRRLITIAMAQAQAHSPLAEDLRVLLPEDWRREFELTWPNLRR